MHASNSIRSYEVTMSQLACSGGVLGHEVVNEVLGHSNVLASKSLNVRMHSCHHLMPRQVAPRLVHDVDEMPHHVPSQLGPVGPSHLLRNMLFKARKVGPASVAA